MIEIHNATKLYGPVIGVNDFSMKLPTGAHGLLGPNGSGKTTLLNLITGQLRPTLGGVRVWDRNPWNCPDVLRRVGICPAADVQHNVSAREWVTFLVELHGYSMAEARRRADDALERVGMTYARDRKISACSKGMKQRAKLAQSLAHDPELLILDEPFNGLDPIGRYEMATLLREWVRTPGRGMLLASHILHEVEAIAPQFLLIRSGRLLASGSSREIHSLLTNVPDQVLLRTSEPRRLAAMLCERAAAEMVRIDEPQGTVMLSTRDSLTLFKCLPDWLAEFELDVIEMSAASDSLQSLFNALMRRHRGEE